MPDKPVEKQGSEQDRFALRDEESPEVEGHKFKFGPDKAKFRGDVGDDESEGEGKTR